ncbi:MAG: ribonuclease H-like domain-containing protein [Bryobacterales bacterium]|nr:ribonuclease H-like domain-containing protein [Bryobacterales bacterium]
MSEFDAQLDELRKRMAAASARVAEQMEARLAQRPESILTRLEEVVPGQEVRSPLGMHFEFERHWEPYRRHGNMEISQLADLPPNLLTSIGEGALPVASPYQWAFLDTETTGLAGGSGTCPFLVGIGRITPDGFTVRQFFMRDFPEEPSMLAAIQEALADAQVLVTYNGKSFDIPLLESRYRLARARPPFGLLPHLDLLYGARRLWRLRFESCRLVELETRILGFERHGDVPGDLIPQIFFDYVRTGRALRLASVFEHNALDIVTLACLTGVVPWAFQSSGAAQLAHGAELISLGRWLRQLGRLEEVRDLFRRAIATHITDELLFRTMWDLAEIEKKLNALDAAIAVYTDLAAEPNPFRVAAFQELAKHYEHRERNFTMALDLTEQAFALGANPELERRRDRLRRKASTPQTARLL